MRLNLVTAPAAEPIDATDPDGPLKKQLRITGSSEDTYLTALAITARELIEAYTHRALIDQTWDAYFDDWPNSKGFALPKGKVSALTSITYIDVDDNSDTVGAITDLATWEDPYPRITLKDGQNWPTVTLRPHDGVIVRYVAGYGATGASVPGPLNQAIAMAATAIYDGCPESIEDMPTVRALIAPWVIDLV